MKDIELQVKSLLNDFACEVIENPNHSTADTYNKILAAFENKNEVSCRNFQYASHAVDWINNEQIKVLSICDAGRFSEGVIVFYYKNYPLTSMPLNLVQ